MAYQNFRLLVTIDGEVQSFDIPAVSVEAALADIKQGFAGEVKLIQYGAR